MVNYVEDKIADDAIHAVTFVYKGKSIFDGMYLIASLIANSFLKSPLSLSFRLR